jgi:hypothetical protein
MTILGVFNHFLTKILAIFKDLFCTYVNIAKFLVKTAIVDNTK